MAIEHRRDRLWLLDHQKWLTDQYIEADLLYQKVFQVNTPYRMDEQAARMADRMVANSPSPGNRKRKSKIINAHEEKNIKRMMDALDDLSEQTPPLFESSCDASTVRENNREVRQLVKKLDRDFVFGDFSGSNLGDGSAVLTTEIQGRTFVIPPKCHYFCGDVSQIEDRLKGNRYDIVLMDPPWENKHISRLQKRRKCLEGFASTPSGYATMSNSDLFSTLPVKQLLSESGVVMVWCTNSKRHIQRLTEAMEESWGVTLSAMWFWLKVTRSGEPVCALDVHQNKLPYERLLVGEKIPSDAVKQSDGSVIVSVPSAIHSHKPPLDKVLSDLGMDDKNRRLEIFGRYLQPNWTTYGDQVLKLQEMHYFLKS